MGNIFQDDFRDFLNALNEKGVEYILVGGFSVIIHGYSRTTGDMDVWVKDKGELQKTRKSLLPIWNARFRYDREEFPTPA